jgi:hypothetical protein
VNPLEVKRLAIANAVGDQRLNVRLGDLSN